jgi:tetratricopeptide (TPR) repeat protein
MTIENKKDILKTVTRYAQTGEWEKVIKEYEKLLQMDPDDISLHNSIGDAYAKIDQDRKAFEHYLIVLKDYQQKENLSKINFLYKKIAKLNPRKFDLEGKALHEKLVKIIEAQEFFNKGDFSRAIPALKEAHKLDSKHLDVLLCLAEACEKQMLIGDSVEAYEKALRLYKEMGKINEAINIAKKIINLDKTNVEALAMLAEEMIKNGEKEKAEELFKDIFISIAEENAVQTGIQIARRAMDLSISYGKQFYAYFLFKDNKIDEAKRILETEYELSQEEKVLLGKIYFKTGEYQKSKSMLLSLEANIINENEELLEQIGDVFLKMAEYKKAAEYYLKAFLLLKSKDMLDEAIAMANKVSNVDSENPVLHENLVEIYIKKNMKNFIIDEYNKLIKIYEKTGKTVEAIRVREILNKIKML